MARKTQPGTIALGPDGQIPAVPQSTFKIRPSSELAGNGAFSIHFLVQNDDK